MHDDLRVFARLAEAAGELRSFDDRAVRNLFSRWVAHHDVRAWIIARVHPEIVWLRDSKRQIVVVTRGTPDEDLITVRRKITTDARELLRLRRFLRGRLWGGRRFFKTLKSGFVA